MRCWLRGHDWRRQRRHLQAVTPERLFVCSRCGLECMVTDVW